MYSSLFLLSASVLCFEITSTRIASLIFASDYAFIILSLAILGLGGGGIYSFYRVPPDSDPLRITHRSLFLLGGSLIVFVAALTTLPITSPFIFFPLTALPFFFAGMVYAQLYRSYPEMSFTVYASDVTGAAFESIASLGLLSLFGGSNGVLLIALVTILLAAAVLYLRARSQSALTASIVVSAALVLLVINGKRDVLGQVPIGNFPEKDFYHVYPDTTIRAHIMDSRWSIYGRSDLVQYSHQDIVRQLFVDGAAGTQLYRFNGNVQHTSSNLQALLLHHTNAIPFLCMSKDEKSSMLIVGPGGGKEVLMGLFGGVKKITGVEVNPDFVRIVKDHKDFDGGIYTDFPNVAILVGEGREFVKKTHENYDLIVMALPSTEQMQNIEPFATNENYLLTKEAIEDFFRILTPEGRLIITVHNPWELVRLLTTTVAVFDEMGISGREIPDHFALFEAVYAPTAVIKKKAFTVDETLQWKSICDKLPPDFPRPHGRRPRFFPSAV